MSDTSKGLVAKVTSRNETINFYRVDGVVTGYRFPFNKPKVSPTATMLMGDSCESWLEWAKDNDYTIDYCGENP